MMLSQDEVAAQIEKIEAEIEALRRRCLPPVMESKSPLLRGRVISSGGGEMRIAVDRRMTEYPAVNERVIVVEPSPPGDQTRNWTVPPEQLARLQRAESQLKLLTPRVGSIWHWEPMSSTASQRLIVTDVKVNADGEVWIESGHPYRLGREVRGEKMWNTLSRWMEAAVLVEPTEGDE